MRYARRSRWLCLGMILGIACGDSRAAQGGHVDAGGLEGGALLPDGVVGRTCAPAQEGACGPKGRCADQLTGGAAFFLFVDPLEAPQGYCTAECSSHAQCGADSVCFGRGLLGTGGECRRACETDGDCDDGQECARYALELAAASSLLPNSCQPRPLVDRLGPDEAGKTCRKHSDCTSYCAEAEHDQGGFCSGRCAEDAHCGEGGVCVRGSYGSGGACRERCNADRDCQNDGRGWGCGEDGVCVRRPLPLPDGLVGKPCSLETEAQDCGSGSCRLEGFSRERYPDGYCVAACDKDADCGTQGVCINRVTCLLGCGSNDDCRPEYECRKHPQAPDSSRTICYPKLL